MKRNVIVRIILWSIMLLVLLALFFALLYVPGGNFLKRESMPEATKIPVPITEQHDNSQLHMNIAKAAPSQIREIEIEWAAGSIRILPKDITEIQISEEGVTQAVKPMIWKVRDGKLAIQYAENKKISLGINTQWDEISKDLLIEVPQDWQCDSLEVTAAAASLEVKDLTIREMEFDGASGSCVFDNCTVEKLDLDTASGDVQFSGSLQQLECDAASADIVLELSNVPRSLDMDTASGDLDVTLPADAGFSVTLDTLSGDFESDFETTMRGGSYVAGSGHCRIDVDAMSGDVTIHKSTK